MPISTDRAFLDTATLVTLSGAAPTVLSVRVGQDGDASLLIQNGGTITGGGDFIGSNSGVTGLVTINGIGSKWTSTDLRVGDAGNGTLIIENGGSAVVSSYITIGRLSSATGTLTLQSGGTLTALSGELGNAGGTATATITGTGSKWTLGSGGIRSNGYATIIISDGGVLSNSSFAWLANTAGTTADVTVTGTGSTWTNSASYMDVGRFGTTTFLIEDGGKVSNINSFIGRNIDSTGIVTVSGAGSEWTSSSSLTVGNGGDGTLTIGDGGKVTATSLSIASQSGSRGTLNIGAAAGEAAAAAGTLTAGSLTFGSGTGNVVFNHTDADYEFAYTLAGAPTLTFLSGTTRLTGTLAAFDGSLLIESGGKAITSGAVLGRAFGNASSASVSGSGSSWNMGSSSLIVGDAGTGHLTLSGQGTLTASSIHIGSQSGSSGTLNIGAASGDAAAAAGFLDVDTVAFGNGTGTLVFNHTSTDYEFAAALVGNGAVEFLSGTTVLSSDISNFTGQFLGTAVLRFANGTSATISTDQSAFAGTTSIANGSTLSITGTLGGTIRVENGGTLQGIGSLGDTIHVQNGGTARSTEFLAVGDGAPDIGIVTVSGTGATFASNGDIFVGNNGTGTLTLTDGGTASTGSGTPYTNNSINRSSSSTIYVGYVAGSSGTLNIGAPSGDTPASAGRVDAAQLVFGDGTGSLVFNHTDSDYEFAAALVGAGTIEFLSGTTILTSDISGFSGQFTGSAGLRFTPDTMTELTTDQSVFAGTTTVTDNSILSVNGALGGTTIVENGGVLKGNGTLGNVQFNAGSTAAPGNSIGTTNVTNVSFVPGSTYEVELNSAGQSDLILATGTATLTGGTVEAVAFPDYQVGSAYTILTAAGGVTGTFDDSTFTVPFISALLSYDATNVYLILAPDSTAIDSAARTPNQRAVVAVTSAEAGSLSFATPLYTSADADTFRAGLDSLSGEIHASMAGSLIGEQQRLRSFAVTDTRRHDSTLTLDDTTFWVEGFGGFGSTSGNNNTARMTHTNAGTLIGGERRNDDRRAGFAVGASSSHVEQDGRSSKAVADNVHLIAYTGNIRGVGKTRHTVGASLSLHSIDTSRSVTANSFSGHSKADYSGRTAEAFAEIAHPLAAGGEATLTPYLQGAVTVQQQAGFSESGEAGLTANTSTTRVASTVLGARYERPFRLSAGTTLHASAGAAWQHLYGDNTPDATLGFTQAPASRFSIQGAPLARDAAILTAALATNATDDLALSLGYDASLAKEVTTHAFIARGSYGF